ncbi:sphingomyelin phosphodiesterase [Marininema halotolerans]|uniref:Phospholipase C n=1 Tax=Marininema halotolerans TaxID=1155944 RepID=A0A1I6S598_9BACL|nr:sphingomyelin phosphodiesterase [Marininema halotolerans]SFS72074.1 phospholipase C [Marininema halotolerans]
MKKIVLTGMLLMSMLLISPIVSANNSSEDLRILTHNVYFLPRIVSNEGQMSRARLIAKADYVKENDVVIFQELFDDGAADLLLKKLKEDYPYQTPVIGESKKGWDKSMGSSMWFNLTNGGVAILSKWPIEKKIQYIYKRESKEDQYAGKGFAYVTINKNGEKIHIMGTHLQSGAKKKELNIKQSQLREIRDFIEERKIPRSEKVFIGGDFNIQPEKRPEEYANTLATLNVMEPIHTEDQRLDFIFAVQGYGQARNWTNKTLYLTSPTWKVFDLGKIKTVDHQWYSDHDPVIGYSN